jgi:hypothetical protein
LFGLALVIIPLTIVRGVLYFGFDGLGADPTGPVLNLALLRIADFFLLSGISPSQPRVVAIFTVYYVLYCFSTLGVFWVAAFRPLFTARANAGCDCGSGAPVCVASLAQLPIDVVSVLTFLAGGVYLCTKLRRRCTSLVRIEALWLTYSRVLAITGSLLLVRLFVKRALLPEWSLARIVDRADLVGVHQIALGLLSSRKRTRELFSRLLASTARELTPAVCLSLFFGGESEEAILASAQQLFKTIPASAIRLEDLLSVEPIASVAVKPTSLGSCDAFISHSYAQAHALARLMTCCAASSSLPARVFAATRARASTEPRLSEPSEA